MYLAKILLFPIIILEINFHRMGVQHCAVKEISLAITDSQVNVSAFCLPPQQSLAKLAICYFESGVDASEWLQ